MRVSLIAIVAGSGAACGSDIVQATLCDPGSGTVTRVLDGDTIELDGSIIVRYLLVDTPETENDPTLSECFAEEAKALNEQLVLEQEVELEYDIEGNTDFCTDNLKRKLAYVSVHGHQVNRIMIERGYATLCKVTPAGRTTPYAYETEFTALQLEAQDTDAGLWGACTMVGGACQ